MSKINRRHFLKNSSLYAGGLFAYSDLFKLVNTIAMTTIQNAQAQVSEYQAKNYLNIHLNGGPARFLFDQWLTPNITDEVLSASNAATWNPGVATALNDNNYEYRLYTYRGVRVPHHMEYPLKTATGDNISVDKLLDHWAVIRGYTSGTDGHEVNNPIQVYPDPAAPSLHALSSDYRKDLISAVDFNGRMPFASMAGKVASIVAPHGTTGSGSVGGLMSVFQKYVPTSPLISNIDQLAGAKTYFRDMMNASVKNFDKTTANAIKDHISAGETLIQFASEDLNSVWSTIYNKYNNAINNSSRIGDGSNAIPFLTDKPVTLATETLNQSDEHIVDRTYDLVGMIANGNYSIDSNVARQLALYEYCLSRGISGVQGGRVGSLLSKATYRRPDGTMVTPGISSDSHEILHKMDILASAAFFRGLMGGILELITYMKATQRNGSDLFSQSVIHVTGDFGRSPRDDQKGYDHGWDAQVTSVFSGAIQGPVIVGNTKKAGKGGYKGTWGIAAPTNFNGASEVLSPRHVGAAMAALVGVPNPWSFTHRVWDLQNGVLVPKVEAKNV